MALKLEEDEENVVVTIKLPKNPRAFGRKRRRRIPSGSGEFDR